MLVSSFIGMMLNYIFHVYMGRTLGPVGYGILGSILSVFYIFTIPGGIIKTVITKFVADFNAKGEYGKIINLIVRSFKKFFLMGGLAFIMFGIGSWGIASFLKIESPKPILIFGSALLFSYSLMVSRGSLQGLQQFNQLGLNIIAGTGSRLLFGILFVLAGFGVNGAIAGYFFEVLIAFVLSLFPLRYLRSEKSVSVDSLPVYKYSIPVFVALTSVTVMTNVDVIMVKHFLSPTEAGFYALASMLSKIIFFTSLTFSGVMLAKASDLHRKNHPITPVLRNTMLYFVLISAVILGTYWILPKMIINIFFGSQYLPVIPVLLILSGAIFFLSVSNIIMHYYLAIDKTSFVIILIPSLFLQILVLGLFHSSLVEVAWALFAFYAALTSLLTIIRFVK
jgi:O-antigen/teichoic acid export membrane protein